MKMISNEDDIIDSRDVIKRREEMEEELESLKDELVDADDEHEKMKAREVGEAWSEENGEELRALQALCEEGEGYPDWKYGATLIRDDFFTDFARELAEDIESIKDSDKWPYTHIDWAEAAEELKQDYGTVEYDGVTYWIRA